MYAKVHQESGLKRPEDQSEHLLFLAMIVGEQYSEKGGEIREEGSKNPPSASSIPHANMAESQQEMRINGTAINTWSLNCSVTDCVLCCSKSHNDAVLAWPWRQAHLWSPVDKHI